MSAFAHKILSTMVQKYAITVQRHIILITAMQAIYSHIDPLAAETRLTTGNCYMLKSNTVEPLLYDHPQNHIGVVV